MMFLALLTTVAMATQHEPVVVELKGSPTVENLQKQIVAPKMGQKFQGRVKFLVPSRSFVKIKFNDDSLISIYEDTEFELPIIEFESNNVPKMILAQGKIRYECSKECSRSLESPLFNDPIPAGDYVFWMSPKIPSFEALVIKGELSFRGLENEKAVTIKTEEKGGFQGVKENNEIAYDVLLKGRKVARGTLQDIQKATKDELKEYSKEAEKKKAIAEKKAKEAAKPKKLPDQICEKPFAKFNECSWVETETGCVRRRCNANGQWADPFVTSKREGGCSKAPVIGSCNY